MSTAAVVMGALNVAATLAGIGLMIKDAIPEKPHDPSEYTTVRIGAAAHGTKEDTVRMEFKGDFPNVRIVDVRGRHIGSSKGGPKIAAGGWREVQVKHEKGMEGVQAEYVYITASGNDAVCVNTVAITWPGGEQWGFLGDIGSMCRADWYYSDVKVTNSDTAGSDDQVLRGRTSNCIWIDKDHSNGIKYAGFGYHILSFGSSKDPEKDGRVFQYQKQPETMCSSYPRYHNIEDAPGSWKIDRIFWPQLEYNDDGSDKDLNVVTKNDGKTISSRDVEPDQAVQPAQSNSTSGAPRNDLFKDRLIKSQNNQHDAHLLCESSQTRGWDFVSLHQGLFCDMEHKQLWPLCSSADAQACFDNEQNQTRAGTHMRRDGSTVAIPPKGYKEVSNWGR